MIVVALLAAAAFTAGALTGNDPRTDPPGPGDAADTAPFAVKPLPGGLSDAQLAGQRLVAGFEGTQAPKGLRKLIREGRIGGVVIFADNVASKGGLRRAIADLQSIPRPPGLGAPLAVMTDQEGGAVERIDGPPSASGAEMGQRGRKFAAKQGRATGRLLRKVGVNIDLAPVLDIGRRGSAISEEGRSFGSRPGTVIGTAVNGFAAGLRGEGVAATAKHFPGFGAAEVNTDFAPQVIDVSRSKLRRVDEAPFRAFVDDGGELVMLSVARYKAFGGEPAALNRAIATRELRGRLGFAGVSVTDSLDAQAVLASGSRKQVATRAASAGSDVLLYGDWRTARKSGRTLAKALDHGRLDRADFEASVRRVLGLRATLSN
ncbi:MAG: hypothetical protein KDB58_00295 [Solirubrobacterales bacterium]|nr:hypothetical protein [Solirubrobacterales bacterium]MCB8970756.1 beta-N-acetylhexosaminidase [Thermoleophilales bacterium]MCO5327624.1 hypothetical protein [Solirubrobacterales bacterium]